MCCHGRRIAPHHTAVRDAALCINLIAGQRPVAFALVAATSPARADCQPGSATAVSGDTVTCSGTAPTGFQAGAGVNNLTINVLNGAVVQDNGTVAIGINDFNRVTNNGTLSVGIFATGIGVGGSFSANNNVITQAGTISGADFTTGIFVGDNNSITNSGAMNLGFGSTGIFAVSSNFIVNSGKITLGDGGSTGILLLGTGNTAINNGSIAAGDGGVGINGGPGFSTIINNGTITLANNTAFGSVGGILAGSNNMVVNNGSILVGSNTTGIGDVFFNNLVINNGTIVTGAFSAGIDLATVGGSNNTVVNNNLIRVGAFGTGIAVGDSNFITNNGTVVAGPNGISIGGCGCSGSNNLVINKGTLDGAINLGGTGNIFANFGLITVSDPGTPVGATHFIGGSLSQFGTGTLALRVNNAAVSDTLAADTASLAGRLHAIVQPGLYGSSTTYLGVVQTLAPIVTQFDQVTTSSVFFTATATYSPLSVDLTLTRIPFGAVPGETQNQRAVGNALEANYSPALTGNAAAFFSALLQATSASVLDQLSGEGTSATQQTAFFAENRFLATLSDQLWLWLGGERPGFADTGAPLGYAPEPRADMWFKGILKAPPAYVPTWNVWASGFGGSQWLAGDPVVVGSANASGRTAGGAAGVDYAANPNLLIGVAVGGSASSFSVPDRATSGRLDGGHLGAYAMQRWGDLYLAGLASYSHFGNTTTRTITGVGPTEIANGSFGSDQLGARLEIGRTWWLDRWRVTPFAAVQVAQLWQQGYVETSTALAGAPGILGLTFAPISVTSAPTFLGAQLDTRVVFADGTVWAPFARAAWVHELNPTRQVTASFLSVPGAGFTVDGARPAPDSLKLDAGARLAFTHTMALFATFTGEYSDRAHSYAGNAGFRASW